ncbi:MAG TPA: hypothetical protein VNH84_19960 [Candidatus Saccharimonadales bacterium]|jgi:hypothetical protein|nr:hypothetical protein [Candidatus Saccharimonadales bacterium]
MSFITQFFIKPAKPALLRVPSGSFTLDRKGKVMACTLPQSFSAAHVRAISQQILEAFRLAEAAKMKLSEIVIAYPALRIIARELRGGILVYLQS